MNEFTGDSSDKTALIREKIQQADAVVIGAGAGLSTAAGFTYLSLIHISEPTRP